MKTLFTRRWLLTYWLAGAALGATAQNVPNNSLDTWGMRNGLEAPTNWQTTDNILEAIFGVPASAINLGAVSKATDAHGGPYAARLTSTAYTDGTVYPGLLLLGNRVVALPANGGYTGGLPNMARPAQLQFYYKLTGAGVATDAPSARVLLTRTIDGYSQPVGSATMVLVPSVSYTQATLPIQYSSSALPDSITIAFASGSTATLKVGTTLLVDDITLSGTALATRADAGVQARLTVWPNPSSNGRFQLQAPDEPALASAPLTVFDLAGRVVAQQPALAAPNPTREVNLSEMKAGMYLLRLDSKQGTLVRQLVVL